MKTKLHETFDYQAGVDASYWIAGPAYPLPRSQRPESRGRRPPAHCGTLKLPFSSGRSINVFLILFFYGLNTVPYFFNQRSQ
jgi:hypothetical protein